MLRDKVRNAERHSGLYANRLGEGNSTSATLFWQVRDFYHSLAKSYLQTAGRDVDAIVMYRSAMDALVNQTLFAKSNVSDQMYARTFNYASEKYGDFMEYTGCYLGAMLALGGNASANYLVELPTSSLGDAIVETVRLLVQMHFAANITQTCNMAANFTRTGLPPARFYFTATEDAINKRNENEMEFTLG